MAWHDFAPDATWPIWHKSLAEARQHGVQRARGRQTIFGYLLSQITPRPRLAVATHFPVADDTVACALASVTKHCPEIQQLKSDAVSAGSQTPPYVTWSFDLMVIRVTKTEIKQLKGFVSDYGWSPVALLNGPTKTPK
jgi:ribonuclease Z